MYFYQQTRETNKKVQAYYEKIYTLANSIMSNSNK